MSAIFVRNTPENRALVKRLAVNCDTVQIPMPADANGNSWRARAERYNFFANSASLYYVLERDKDAAMAIDEAEAIFADDSNLHLLHAELLEADNHRGTAEQEYKRSLEIRPSDAAWFALGQLYYAEHRYPEAARAVAEAASLSLKPYERQRALGRVFLAMKEPSRALEAYARAEKASPYRGEGAQMGAEFNAEIADGRAMGYQKMGELPKANAQAELATRLTPDNSARWSLLATLYHAADRSDDEDRARAHAGRAMQNSANRASGKSSAPVANQQ